MLEVFAVFFDQGGPERDELFAELGDDFRPYEVFYGLFRGGFGVDVDVELKLGMWLVVGLGDTTMRKQGNIRHTHLPLCRALPPVW